MYNEHKKLDGLISRLKLGIEIAIISDAGTPGISDPGFLIIRSAISNNIEVDCLPGPTALIPALIKSGLPCERFIFEGFLPKRKGRNKRLESLSNENRTIIFYESPHKLLKTLTQFNQFFDSDRSVSISREISKMHEETFRGSLLEAVEYFTENNPRGEFVICLGGLKNNQS